MRLGRAGVTGLAGMLLWSVVVWGAEQERVAVVRSDWRRLPAPVAADRELDLAQTEMVVRAALEELGGMRRFVGPEDRWVVIKPNLVTPTWRGSGDITDAYVVWAVARLVHEANPKARITIAEGPGEYVTPGHPEALEARPEVDGFALAGFAAILGDTSLADAPVELLDLNFDESVSLQGAATGDAYWVPRTVRDCDVFIDVPVLKVTSSIGFTCAMKNLVGILPGNKYGWPKSAGFPPNSGNPGIPNHYETRFDELIVDLHSIGRVDLVVVDAIVGMERGRIRATGGYPRRLNTIVAGRDAVAVDAVCTRLVGFNPDDFEFITLAERLGLGTGDLRRLKLVGQPLAQVETRFAKVTGEDEAGRFGQSNRIWLVKGPWSLADEARWRPEPGSLAPRPGVDGWSQAWYFSDDRIDLRPIWGRQSDSVGYAWAEFTAPRAQQAELWVGSAEDLVVWLNGQEAYRFAGSRMHRLANDRVPVRLRKGRNALLVEVTRRHRTWVFSLNVCEPEPDERYAGNRVRGLRFLTPEGATVVPVGAVGAGD